MAPKGGAQKGGVEKGGEPKISRFFFPFLPQKWFFPLWVLSWNFGGVLKRRSNVHVRSSLVWSPGGPVWWGRRGFTRQPESPNVHILGFRPSKTPPKFSEKTPREGKQERIENKERNYGRSSGRAVQGKGGGGLESEADTVAMGRMATDLARADIPLPILTSLRMGRLISLQKPTGGVRGIVGEFIRHLVARSIAQQLVCAEEVATSPFQHVLSTTAGGQRQSSLH